MKMLNTSKKKWGFSKKAKKKLRKQKNNHKTKRLDFTSIEFDIQFKNKEGSEEVKNLKKFVDETFEN